MLSTLITIERGQIEPCDAKICEKCLGSNHDIIALLIKYLFDIALIMTNAYSFNKFFYFKKITVKCGNMVKCDRPQPPLDPLGSV